MKQYDNLAPGDWIGEMGGTTKDDIEWYVDTAIRVVGYTDMEGWLARDTIQQCVRKYKGDPNWSASNGVVYVVQTNSDGFICGLQSGLLWGALLKIQRAPFGWKFGGPVIRDWGSHVMRNDRLLRKDAGYPKSEQEAYTLFREDGTRMASLTGGINWAMKECERLVNEDSWVKVCHG